MALTGELKDFGLVTLIQLNCIERKNARLTIQCQGKEAILYFENGEITHAQYDGLTGTPAIHQALTCSDGTFRMEEGFLPPVRTNRMPWMQVIMESIRLLDEQRAFKERRPVEERVVEDLSKVRGVGWVLVMAADGTIAAHSGLKTPDRIGALVAFFSGQSRRIGARLRLGRSQQLALTCSGNQIALLYRENYTIAVFLDSGINVEIFNEEASQILRKHFPERVLAAGSV